MNTQYLPTARKDYRVGAYVDGKRQEIIPCSTETEVSQCCQMLKAQGFQFRVTVGAKPPLTIDETD